MPKIDKNGNITEDPVYESRTFDEWPHEGFFTKTPCKNAGEWILVDVIEVREPSTFKRESRCTSIDEYGNNSAGEWATYEDYDVEVPGKVIGHKYFAKRRVR